MIEHSIIFSEFKIRRILEWDFEKNGPMQTRRIVKPQPLWIGDPYVPFKTPDADPKGIINCRYGKRGDHLWVRETWNLAIKAGTSIHSERIPHYRADGEMLPRWKSPILMPRRFARIFAEIINIRVEQIADISLKDCIAEGIQIAGRDTEEMRGCFRKGWDELNAKRGFGWMENPWVWVIEFKRIG